jgi:hypothetical protein
MESNELLWVCFAAFVADGLLLGFLALVMRLVMALFPAREDKSDGVLVAAIASLLHSVYPGSKITKVEEIP